MDGFHGADADGAAGVVPFGVRHTLKDVGMWLQPEPLLYLGMAAGDVSLPRLYTGVYSGANPVHNADRSGRFRETAATAGTAAAGAATWAEATGAVALGGVMLGGSAAGAVATPVTGGVCLHITACGQGLTYAAEWIVTGGDSDAALLAAHRFTMATGGSGGDDLDLSQGHVKASEPEEFKLEAAAGGAGALSGGGTVHRSDEGGGGDDARVPPGQRTWREAGISEADSTRIQNAADRTGQRIDVVGSRASNTAGPDSDWDYVMSGNSARRHSASSSVPHGTSGGALGTGGWTGIDVFPGKVNPSLPHVTFLPAIAKPGGGVQ